MKDKNDMKDENVGRLLERIDLTKRDFLRRLIVGTAFAAPMVSSFGLNDLSTYAASAQVPNS